MYVPLRVHSHHSLMTGVGSPAAMLQRAAALGMPALGLCDILTLGGMVEGLQAAEHSPVRPIIGAELNAPGGFATAATMGSDSQHYPGRVVALVQTEEGYQNLCKLISARQLGYDPGSRKAPPEGGFAQAKETFDLVHAITRWKKGLLFLVDHPALLLALFGRVPAQQIFAALSPACIAASAKPLQPEAPQVSTRASTATRAPDGLSESNPRAGSSTEKVPDPSPLANAKDLIGAAQATGAALLAVPDVYYPNASDRHRHLLQVAVKHNALLADLPPAWLAPTPAHLLSTRELRPFYANIEDVPGEWPVTNKNAPLLERTLAVAETCTFRPALGGVLFPSIELEEGETPYSRLCQLAFEGARQRFRPMGPEVFQRLQYELSTLQNLGFAPYFLLVNRIAQFAREQDIPHVGRGSAADSLVAYCLRLTDADPFRYRLPFERFLNPARSDRPDVDLDFCWRRRDEVLEHVFELFGSERTAMISTLNRFGARSAFREAALVHGIPPAEFQRWSRRIPMYGGDAANFDGTADTGGKSESFVGDPPAGNLPTEDPPGEDRTSKNPAGQHPIDKASEWRRTSNDGTVAQPIQKKPEAGGHSRVAEELTHPGGGGGGLAAQSKANPAATPSPPLNPIAATLRSLPETRDFPFHDPRFAAALRDAATLLDTPRHFGLHPGGVVVAPNAITDCLPCSPSSKGPIVTQFDKDGVEALGLVKMDLLGNRALTTLRDTLDFLAQRGVDVDLTSVSEDDPTTAELLRRGHTLGCFQIESPGMRHLLQQTGACTMDAVIQAVALIRPGPAQAGMKEAYVRRFRKLENPTPPHPCLEELLRETYGIMLYQEDVMQVAATAAGMDLPTADRLRRALQKRKLDELPDLHRRFTRGCIQNGLSAAEADHIWERIEGFASFAFCKAHSVTYGRIAYHAAWLKAHHPVEFLTAFLNSETGYYATRVYVEEARRLGAPILGPDVNRSTREFSLHHRASSPGNTPVGLRLGFQQVFGLSSTTIDRILEERRVHPFLSLPDFLERTQARSDEARHLIRCGAFDTFDRTRPELLWRLHLLRRAPTRAPREAQLDAQQLSACQPGTAPIFQSPSAGWGGQGLGLNAAQLPPGGEASLFTPLPDSTPVLPGLPDWNAHERGIHEHELLGVSLAAHPTQLYPCPGEQRMRQVIRSRADRRAPMPPRACADLSSLVGARITLRAWLAASRRVRTKDGSWMRFLTLEDRSGIAEAILFPNVYQRTGEFLRSDETLLVSGVVEDQLGACLLRAEHIW